MKLLFAYLILTFLLISACSKKKSTIITFDLKRSDYLEAIDATGTIQAVNNFTLVSPRVNVSSLEVTYLPDEGTHVKKGDTICILDAPEIITYIESFNTDLEKMDADMKKLEADNAMELALLKAQVETNKAQMQISMLDSIQIKFAPAMKQRLLALELEKANVEKKKLQKKFAAQKRIDNSELIQMRSRIMMQKNRIKVYQDQIKLLTLVAPCDGIIMHYESPVRRFATMSVGGVAVGTMGGKIEEGSKVWSSITLLQIPDMKEMQVSVEVPEADYKRIENGQKVLIRVEASINLNTTGKIKRKTLGGKNTQVSTAIKTYEVIISVDSCHLKMKPGLSASCRIIVNHVKDTLVVPAAAIFDRDSSKIVYVAVGEKFMPVIVGTGFSNSSHSIISKGLAGNETISLMEPPHNLIRKEMKSKADTITKFIIVKKDTLLKTQQ